MTTNTTDVRGTTVEWCATEPFTVLGLLGELSDLRTENKALRRKVAALEQSRSRWRAESRAWQWGALRWQRKRSP